MCSWPPPDRRKIESESSGPKPISLQDTLNEASLAAVTDLQAGRWAGVETEKRAMRVTMLTGDNEASARHFSQVSVAVLCPETGHSCTPGSANSSGRVKRHMHHCRVGGQPLVNLRWCPQPGMFCVLETGVDFAISTQPSPTRWVLRYAGAGHR